MINLVNSLVNCWRNGLSGFSDKEQIRIGTFGMLNNPEYRQEPWRENIASRLNFFDVVCLVCGNEADLKLLKEAFPVAWDNGKLIAVYKPWPFPEWSYEELPKHLNAALKLVREQGCDWAVKLDIDTVFHEKDFNSFNSVIKKAERRGDWLVSFGKLQFFLPKRYWVKSNMPIALKLSAPIAYGFDELRYTDLCQPIEWNNLSKVSRNGMAYDIPSGKAVSKNKIYHERGIKVYNYDYTFRTYERSAELLYQIDMAHARFWGKGYSGLPITAITRESAINDFLALSRERYEHMCHHMEIKDHPKDFQTVLQNLQPAQWGYNLWNQIKIDSCSTPLIEKILKLIPF